MGVSPDRLTVDNGLHDLNQMGRVLLLNGKSMLHPWSSDECNSVGGSDGMFFPREDIKHEKTIHLFHKDSCRKLPMIFHSKEKVSSVIKFAWFYDERRILIVFLFIYFNLRYITV